MNCKHCGSTKSVKNGYQNGKQNRKCKDCGRNFTENDRRCKDRSKEKAVCFLLYALGKASMRFLADLFKVSVRTIYVWLKGIADSISVPAVSAGTQEIEIDEMWHYLRKKLESSGYSRHMTVLVERLSPGLQVVVILQQCEDFTPN